MDGYRRILAAVDMTEEGRAVGARACELARAAGGVVKLLHVVEFVPIEPMSDSLVPVVQIDDQMLARARRQLEELAAALGLPADAGSVETGNAKSEILRYAREHHIDLIVIGCRERHGLSLLVHRTEDSVLHAAPCDVLAVRVREPAAVGARPRGRRAARGHTAAMNIPAARHKIRVEVETAYLEHQSEPHEHRFVFSYTITIRNEGDVPAKLLTRHWVITDANGQVEEVHGEGVVGEQPHLRPGQGFRYSSAAALETPVGSMHGSYQMIADDGSRFDAPIPAFRLAIPGMLH